MANNVNRYVQFQPQQYVSNYIPLPLNEIMQIGQQKQAQQDAAMADISKVESGIKSINALPRDKDYAIQKTKELTDSIDKFTTMDFNDPNTRNMWNKERTNIAARFAPTGDLGMIDTNYKLATEWNKNLQTSGQKAGWGTDKLQGYGNSQLNNWKTIDETGNTRMFQGQEVANRVDYNDWASKALKDVAASTDDASLKEYGSLDAFTKAYKYGKVKELTYNKIMNALAMRAAGDQQLIQSLKQEGKFNGQEGWDNFIKGTDKKGNVVVDTNNPFGAILTGIATGGAFREVDSHYLTNQDDLGLYNAKKQADNEETSTPKTLPSGILIPNLSQYKVNVPSGNRLANTSFFAAPGEKYNPNLTKPSDYKFTPEQDELAKKAAAFYGTGISADPVEKGKLINKYIEDFSKSMQSPTILEYTNPKFIENENQRYFSTTEKGGGQAYDREFIGIGSGDKMTGADFMKKYGDKKEYTISTTGRLTADNPYYSAGEVVTVRDKSGKLVNQFAMEGNETEKTESRWLNDVYSVKYNPVGIKETSIPIYNPDGSYAGTTDFKLDYRRTGTELTNAGNPILPNEELTVEVKDSNGNWVPYKEPFTSEKGGDVFNTFLQTINSDTNITPSR